MRITNLLKIAALVLLLQGCQSAYYSAMESFGKHKRDLLADEVENAQEAQQEAQQQFASALEQLSTLIAFDGGDLQDQFEATEAQYEASVDAADAVSERIDNIENVAYALFNEWADEIEQYSSAKLKRQSESQLRDTQRRYQRLLRAMQRAEGKMAPVLAALKDNTLYLKHNLNAKAIGALEGEYQDIKTDINALISEMNKAIKESQQFLSSLSTEN
ncbi:DUF2959 domain-containing protein [Thalassotalea euphylliae]|uniref:DUF2959 domain-containing protein n=1 Tax=Thalassotalea euphylliae TaxID=1655234 RepID=A0A3E0U250_9GAMM|nr:DUF2959 domain-containing protein [Thalassotalea euphylliae]REL31061.1 DUF2959 domain-containing protein [Thalassotalea euphylliae]